ncbi:MAG: hypothetical protein AABZ06_12630 [Bdellovibrionota bacterium]
MKLYEFTYTDNENLSEPELLRRVGEFLLSERDLQGWAPDYKFQQCKQVEQLVSGKRVHSFEVIGKYLSTDSVGFDEELSEASSSSRPAAAAAPDINP